MDLDIKGKSRRDTTTKPAIYPTRKQQLESPEKEVLQGMNGGKLVKSSYPDCCLTLTQESDINYCISAHNFLTAKCTELRFAGKFMLLHIE